MTNNQLFNNIVDLVQINECDIESIPTYVAEDYVDPYNFIKSVDNLYNVDFSIILQMLSNSRRVHSDCNLLRSDMNNFNINPRQTPNLLRALHSNISALPKPKRRYL